VAHWNLGSGGEGLLQMVDQQTPWQGSVNIGSSEDTHGWRMVG